MSNIFWSNIFKSATGELQTITGLWQKTPLFEGIPARQIEFLSRKMHVRKFLADEVIFRQGDGGAGAILVLEGSVRVMANKTQLAQLEAGDFFGEIELAEPEHRTADAFSIHNSSLVYFLRQDLEEWIEYEPRLGAKFLMNLSSTLAKRLLQANKLIAEH